MLSSKDVPEVLVKEAGAGEPHPVGVVNVPIRIHKVLVKDLCPGLPRLV